MERNKILLAVLLSSLALMVFQLDRLASIPAVDRDLILNQQSFMEVANHESRARFISQYEDFAAYHSSSPTLIQYDQLFQCCSELFKRTSHFNHLSFAAKNNLRQANHLNALALESHNDMLAEVNTFGNKKISFTEVKANNISDDDLAGLAIQNFNARLTNNYLIASNLLQNTGATYCGFTNLEGFMMMSIGKKSIHDSLEVLIPNPIKIDLSERVQIKFNKKFVNSLVDSLKTVGQIQHHYRNTYVVKANLAGSDLQIRPFDNETQTITESEYTKWDYEITSPIIGIKNLRLSIGIALEDSAMNNVDYDVVLPLRSVQVIE
jgi:hypothetical protein